MGDSRLSNSGQYISQDKLKLTLVVLTKFRNKVYLPSFFEVEAKNSITDDPRNHDPSHK